MKNVTSNILHHRSARIAGFMFLFILTTILLNSFVFSKLIVTENALATADTILTNTWLFRLGIINELILSVCAILLALALYITLKQVNRHLALLALYLKLVEGILSAVIALLNFIGLQVLLGKDQITTISEQSRALVGLFLNMHDTLYAIPMVFLGLNLVLFSYLFLKSRYVPKSLAVFGMVSYALVLGFALVSILFPKLSALALTVPSILFELIIGVWLLTKGIKEPDIISEANQTKH
ncbi:DUF4386 domain-containing protein [Arenibacter echinorum]|uniref:Uncharacterized protein DUF4386 n=1 Tax=Arenibacter echinorum TaxID=440515 RepID=A0A327R5I1_9FLAO|nr:DUF4386 domain-containing protein [Arenibacter echinorum]RAJ11505.1 uncharacterized protein DUF4386 [Arenibacter echinorum]